MANTLSSSVPQLKRSLNLTLITFYGLGNILGAGIYVLIGKVAGAAGMYAPLAFVVACVVATFTALSYAELSSRYPVSAGEAVYIEEGFGYRRLSMLVGLLVSLAAAVSAATITHGFVGYLQVFVDINPVLAMTLVLLVLTGIAAAGVKHAVGFAAALTIVEITGLLIVIFAGGDALFDLPERSGELIPDFSVVTGIAVLAGGFLAFYAFLGFEDMVNVAEEVKNPERNMSLAIIISLVIATLFYFLVALIAVLSVPPAQLSASDAPLALVYETVSGRQPVAISLISLFAVVNGALIQIIMISRILYGMSVRQWLPPFFSEVNQRTHTPVKSTFIVGGFVWLMAIAFPIVTLAKATSFFVLAVFVLVNLALIRIKRRNNDGKGYTVWVPILGVVFSSGLVLFEVIYSG